MDRRPQGLKLTAEQDLIVDLRARLREAEETLDAIRCGEVDAVLVRQSGSSKIFTLVSADRPYRFLIEQMKEGAVTLSEEGVVLYGNRRLGELLGVALEKVVGSNIKRFLAGNDLVKFETLLAARGPARAEFSMGLAGAPATSVYLSINDIVSDPDAPRLIGGVLSDLTQQHELEARFRQAQKMEAVTQLTGGLAHDFNNLLQAVWGNLNLIKMRPGDAAAVAKWADSGLKAALQGARLTSQLMAFSRTQLADLQPVDVAHLVDGMSDLLRRTLGPGIALECELERAATSVLADKTQLELALVNLTINAREAMPAGGLLRITSRLRSIAHDPDLVAGEYLELCVTDTGCGMADNVRSRAFEPFYTTRSVGEGSGLGLAQVYGIARQAGGAARILSAPGAGTTVSLLLRQSLPGAAPRADEPPVAGVEAPRDAASVLVVDDDDDVRSVLVDALTLLGFRVSQASSGSTALAMMAAQLPDLLLTDYAMPRMNGAELVRTARASGFDMPVIFATGYAFTEALNAAVGFKADVLLKPFSMPTLLKAVQAALAGDARHPAIAAPH